MKPPAQLIIYHPNGDITEVLGYRKASEITGLSQSRIADLARLGKQSREGYMFDFLPDYKPSRIMYSIELVSPDGRKYVSESLRYACIITGISDKTILKLLPCGEYNGWIIKGGPYEPRRK